MSKILSRIAEKHPLSHEHSEDGRYVWPERWHEAHIEVNALEAKLNTLERQREELIVEVAMLAKCLRANGISMEQYAEFAIEQETGK